MFNAGIEQPYVAIGDACLRLFLGRELRVGSAGWMNGERASVAEGRSGRAGAGRPARSPLRSAA